MLAFLKYNFYPAKIFLGDSGSTFAGFIIASISVLWVIKSQNALFLLVPIIFLALPIFDTLFAIFRRYREHRPIFQADQGHLHHRLLSRGIKHKNVVLFLWGLTFMFNAIALIFVFRFRSDLYYS